MVSSRRSNGWRRHGAGSGVARVAVGARSPAGWTTPSSPSTVLPTTPLRLSGALERPHARRFAYGVGHETMANAERQLTSVTQRPFAARQALRPSPIWEDVLLVRPAREAPRMLEPPT